MGDIRDVKIIALVLRVGLEPIEQEVVVVLRSHTVISEVVFVVL